MGEYLEKLLEANGIHFEASSQHLQSNDIKEKMCYVASDFKTASEGSGEEKTYKMTDGRMVKVCKERFLCPEVLFKFDLTGKDLYDGIHDMIHKSIMKCDEAIRQDLYGNVLLSGGTTMFAGIRERWNRSSILWHLK